MDITEIDATKVTTADGIIIGSPEASKTIIEFMNLRCPYCKQWFHESYELLDEGVKKGQVKRVIKLLDKEKKSLQSGNMMHRFVNRQQPESALEEILTIYSSQDEWGHLSPEAVADFAREKLQLQQHSYQTAADHIAQEAEVANIKFVPTLILGSHIFDESVSHQELKQMLQ